MNEPSSFNAFADALAQFDRLADLMGLDTPTRELLRNPAHEHRLTLPVRLDDGSVEVAGTAADKDIVTIVADLPSGVQWQSMRL